LKFVQLYKFEIATASPRNDNLWKNKKQTKGLQLQKNFRNKKRRCKTCDYKFL